MKAILFNDTSNEKHIGSYLVIKNIKDLCKKNNIALVQTYTRKKIEKDSVAIHNFIQSSNIDLVIVNGEGSLHRCPKFFNIVLDTIPNSKKAVLINTVWEKMIIRDIKLLDKFALISVRESISYEKLYSMYPKKKIIITPDIIFYSKLEDSPIGYGDSVMTGLLHLLQEYPNYFPLNYIDNLPSITAYLRWLKSLDLYITGRFHGVCLASIINVPFLTFPSNSHKIEGILKDMNCQQLLINSFEDVEQKKVIAKESAPKAHKYAIEAKEKIEKLFQRIAKL